MKWLALIAVILFCSSFWICTWLYPDNLLAWWDLRIFIYSIIFAICFYFGYLLTKGITKAIFLVGIVFVAGDVIDRYIFDINRFNANDILLYVFAIYYLTHSYAREIRPSKQ